MRSTIQGRDRLASVPILDSVFGVWSPPDTKDKGKAKAEDYQSVHWLTLDHEPPLSEGDFGELVDKVRRAIESGVQPRLNQKGSSGSYFAKDPQGVTVAIFKPKDEEVSTPLTRSTSSPAPPRAVLSCPASQPNPLASIAAVRVTQPQIHEMGSPSVP